MAYRPPYIPPSKSAHHGKVFAAVNTSQIAGMFVPLDHVTIAAHQVTLAYVS